MLNYDDPDKFDDAMNSKLQKEISNSLSMQLACASPSLNACLELLTSPSIQELNNYSNAVALCTAIVQIDVLRSTIKEENDGSDFYAGALAAMEICIDLIRKQREFIFIPDVKKEES